jgi:hypothetical protein
MCLGITSFLIVRMWFGKAVHDFNASILSQGSQAPQLVADTGNAFTSAYIDKVHTESDLLIDLQSGLGRICLLRCPRHHLTLKNQCKSIKMMPCSPYDPIPISMDYAILRSYTHNTLYFTQHSYATMKFQEWVVCRASAGIHDGDTTRVYFGL